MGAGGRGGGRSISGWLTLGGARSGDIDLELWDLDQKCCGSEACSGSSHNTLGFDRPSRSGKDLDLMGRI